MLARARRSPLRRVIALMKLLTEVHDRSHGDRVLSDQELLDLVGEYGEGANAVRTLNLDKSALKARGLIRTNQRHPEHARVRGTRREPYLEKAGHLWLTSEEHRALRAARQDRLSRTRFPVGPTSVPAKAPNRTNASVDDALRLLRLLEEYGGEVGVDVVADCFGIEKARARDWLVQIADGFDDASLIEVRYVEEADQDDGDGMDDSDSPAPVVRAVALAVDEAAQYPFAKTGTALLGLFGYSQPEVDERLALIAEHRLADAPDEATLAVLDSIESKLTQWAQQMQA